MNIYNSDVDFRESFGEEAIQLPPL